MRTKLTVLDGTDYILYTIWQMPFYIYGLVV